jgi:hypothetical protein
VLAQGVLHNTSDPWWVIHRNPFIPCLPPSNSSLSPVPPHQPLTVSWAAAAPQAQTAR